MQQRLGNEDWVRIRYLWFAELSQAEGDYSGAVQLYRVSLTAVKRDPSYWPIFLVDLATLAETLDLHEPAARLLGAIQIIENEGLPLLPIHQEDYNQVADATRGHLGAASFYTAWAQGWEQGHHQEFAQIAEEALSTLEATV